MVCYQCGGDTAVFNSRHQKRTNHVWRRRRCVLCDTTFTSIESIDYSRSLKVRGTTERDLTPLSRDRLLLSLHASLQHRPTALTDTAGLTATILHKAAGGAEHGIVDVSKLMDIVVVALNRFDKLAAQHYRAMHKK